ncbi:hypothetical protein AKJ51_02610 [candidate division MSBL1 archaeon SCGC-AAA382A20]|uniref:histidine kinase n=1 Tax=candidate division MSBL1 archaeon SCGC-AAA382A20 TaxID=1698280 RepID=A0A133VKA9_9EURY|nr:hypothetical protein AKJ51_02610 [candidate division MSBL1 archaeon SCGC-AAA382A20]
MTFEYICENCSTKRYPSVRYKEEKCNICGRLVRPQYICSECYRKLSYEEILDYNECPSCGEPIPKERIAWESESTAILKNGTLTVDIEGEESIHLENIREIDLNVMGSSFARVENPKFAEFASVDGYEKMESCVDLYFGNEKDSEIFERIEKLKEEQDMEWEDLLHSMLRHDLRNKTQITRGYLELLKDFDLPKKAERYIDNALNGVQEGIDLIEKVRKLQQVKGEKVKEVNIISDIQSVLDKYQGLAERNEMKISTRFPRESLMVEGGSLLNEVISNIVENAIRHSGGSRIRISVVSKGGEVICSVEDDGCGIPDEDKRKIFHKNYTRGESLSGGSRYVSRKDALEKLWWESRSKRFGDERG